MDDGILDGRGRYCRAAANENFSWMYNVWRRWAAPIRKLIEHLRIESKPGPVGIDILDIGGWVAFNTRWRRENGSGKQWLPGLRRRSDDNGCDRLFRDVTCPRFSCNFIRLMTARDGPRICSLGKKNNQRLFPETVIYSFSKKNNPFFFPPTFLSVSSKHRRKGRTSRETIFDHGVSTRAFVVLYRIQLVHRSSYFLKHQRMSFIYWCGYFIYLVPKK